MQQKNENYWLFDAPVNQAIWHMAIPMILGMSVNIIYNITDTFFIGKLNNTSALAAITLLLPYTTVLMALGNLFGTGGSTLFARLLGTKNFEKAKQAAATSFYLSLFFGLLATIVTLIFNQKIALLLGGDANTSPFVQQYMCYYGIGAPFVVANFTLEQLIRGNGDSIESMIGMVISVMLNIILDPILIFTCQLGLKGAAIATIIGNISAVIYYIICISKKEHLLSLSLIKMRFDKQLLTEIFTVGFSALLLDLLLILSSLMFNFYAIKYGENVLAGFGISQKIVQIVDLIGMGLYLGVIPLIAVAYGSKNFKKLKLIIRQTATYLGIIISLLFVILFFSRHWVMQCFTNQAAVIQIGGVILTVQLCSTFFAAGAGLLTGIFQAEGKGLPATVMSITRGCILIPAIMLGNHFFQVYGVIFSLLVAEAIACLTGLILYLFQPMKINQQLPLKSEEI